MAIKKASHAESPVKSPAVFDDKKGIVINSFPGYFLILCIVASAIFLYWVFEPFLTTLILAGILATAFYPLYEKILKGLKFRKKLASFLTMILVLVVIIVPILIFFVLLWRQTYDTFVYLSRQLMSGAFDQYLKWEHGGIIYDALSWFRQYTQGFIDFDSLDLKAYLIDFAKNMISFTLSQSANIIKGFGWLLLSLFILVFAMYYFFKDADLIVDKLMTLSPLPDKHEKRLFQKFKEISLATLYGIFLTAIIQGVLAGVGFFIAGVPNALFWGTATALFSLVPLTGAATIWVPSAIFLFISGNWIGGVFLMIWGAGVVSTSDNFVRAWLIGASTNMNQLLTFLAVFGGIAVFGLEGVIFGPMILNLFFAFLHIYEKEYDKVLHKH